MEPNNTPSGSTALKIGVLVALLIVCIGIVSIGLMLKRESPARNVPMTIGISADIEKEAAKLVMHPWKMQVTLQKAEDVKNAIKRGDYAEAKNVTADIVAKSHIDHGRIYPFNRFIQSFDGTQDDEFERHLGEWVERDKDDFIPLVIRAQYYADVEGDTRGANFSYMVQPHNMEAYETYRSKAFADIDEVIRLNNKLSYAYYLKMSLLSQDGNTPEYEKAFQQGIAQFPDYYNLYRMRLAALAPKWGGTIDSMYDFVESYAGKVPNDNPMKLLYLQLYADLLDTAWIGCNIPGHERTDEDMKACVTAGMEKLVRPKLESDIQTALQLYQHADKYQILQDIEPILSRMVNTPGGEAIAGKVLQMAAAVMGSDTQMTDNNPGHNNYLLDLITAQVWRHKSVYDNAERKYKEALLDIETAPFPNEEEKAIRVSSIYEALAYNYKDQSQYENALIYHAAAKMVNTGVSDFIECDVYRHLKRYKEAIQVCNPKDGYTARFFRATAYFDLEQWRDALQDFKIVADSEDAHRESAVFHMSNIYAVHLKDYTAELKLFERYPYVFEERFQSRDTLALAYNNRCYAYLHLDQLQKALDDCDKSLTFGDMPDAYQKKQEILKRMKTQ